MAIVLHKAGYEHAFRIIKKGLEVEHTRNNWQECAPDKSDEAKFINTHSLAEYGNWFLGVDTNIDQKNKERYVYPFGDFNMLHVGALEAIREQAKRKGDTEIHTAAERLLASLNQKS